MVLGTRHGTLWPIRSRVITTSSALVRCWTLLGGPSVGFIRCRSLPCTETSLWFEPPVGYWSLLMVSNLHNEQSSSGLCHGHGSTLPAGVHHYSQCHNGLAPNRSWYMWLCRSMPIGGSWYDKWEGFVYLHPQSPAIWVEYSIVLYRNHVPIIVQCQGNGCSHSSKNGVVVQESFGHLATGHPTILEIAVGDRRCPHHLVNLRSVSSDFIMWSLSIMILSEFGLGLI